MLYLSCLLGETKYISITSWKIGFNLYLRRFSSNNFTRNEAATEENSNRVNYYK